MAALDVIVRADLTEVSSTYLVASATPPAASKWTISAWHSQGANLLAPTADKNSGALVAVMPDLLMGNALPGGARDHPSSCEAASGRICWGKGGHRRDFAEAERGVLQRALARTDGSLRGRGSARLSRATLHRKLKQLAIKRAD